MIKIIKIIPLSIYIFSLVFSILAIFNFIPQIAHAGEGTRIGLCTKERDERLRNECLYQLEQGAIEACRGVAQDQQRACKDRWKASNVPVSNELPDYDDSKNCTGDSLSRDNCGIIGYIVITINVLSGLAGVVIVGSIVYAGILYAMAGNDPQKVSAAKDRIRDAVIGLVLFIFGFAILNYLIPGGLL